MAMVEQIPIVCYDVITQPISISGQQALVQNVNAWAVANTGDDIVQVNGKTLLPRPSPGLSGESFGVSGNLGELYNRQYLTLQFQGVGANPQVELTQKYYVKKG